MAQVYVENLTSVIAALKRYEPELVPVLRTNVKGAIDTTSLQYIRGRTVRGPSGDAIESIKASSGGNSFYIRAGDTAPYFGWLDFGGVLKPTGRRYNTQVRPKVKGGRYVYPGFMQSMPELENATQKALDTITVRFNR